MPFLGRILPRVVSAIEHEITISMGLDQRDLMVGIGLFLRVELEGNAAARGVDSKNSTGQLLQQDGGILLHGSGNQLPNTRKKS
jgi:hypothetical protein